jgi:hypothetical protein
MNPRRNQRRFAPAACALIALITGLVCASPAHAQTTFSGRAFAAFVSTPLTGPMFISDTGQLPPSGGARDDALLDTRDLGLATLNSVLTAEVLAASTSGASGEADSSASLANVVVLPGNAAQVTASFVQAESHATCSGVSGSSEIVGLTFGGMNITVTGQPNQTVTLPGGVTLIINEQTTTSNGTYRQIRVNALHLIVPGVAEVILSSAESDINCTGTTTQGPCQDFVTGGGWIVTTGTSHGNFGLNAGFKPESLTPTVHLNYIDHASGMKVNATSITVYRPGPTATSRHFTGSAAVDGVDGYGYSVDLADNGEPGKDADTFSISLSSNGRVVYQAGGTLEGGNIQLHKPCP